MSARVLIVEDEPTMRLALQDRLQAEGYRVLCAADGPQGLDTAIAEEPDAILLDVMMPGLDGLSVCRQLRKLGKCMPILMLTARGQLDDRVDGLDAGADDYLAKPFATRELLARLRALLRRSESEAAPVNELRLGDFHIDFRKRMAWKNGQKIHCASKEIAMLRLLAERAGEVVSRNQFLDLI
jgi:two-component system response regulator MprA